MLYLTRHFLHSFMQTLAVSAIFLFLPTLYPSSYAKSLPTGAGGGDVPTNVLLMLDVSGSMNTIQPTGDTRYPVDVAYDSNDNVYVARYLDSIEKYDAAGKFLINIGSNNGRSGNGQFNKVYAVATDSNDNLYVSDYGNGRIQKFSSQGNYIRSMGLTTSTAKGVAVDKNNYVYAVNGNGKIEKFNSTGSRLQTWSNTSAEHVATDANNYVYITTLSQKTIQKYNSSGQLQQTIHTSFEPFGIDVAQNGDIYVSDASNNKIYAYTASGSYKGTWGSTGSGTGQFQSPRGVDFSANGTLWIADYQNNRVQSLAGVIKLDTEEALSRLKQAVKIIKDIVSDSSLTENIHFGLMTWSSNSNIVVGVSSTGASQIYNIVDTLYANGGTNLDKAMTLAKNYVLGPSDPMNIHASCQKNMMIVISDGEWTDNSSSTTAKDLYDNYNIRTFAVGFQALDAGNYVSINYENLSKNGGSYPDSPLYADNWEQLNEVLRGYLNFATDSSLTFSAPTIIPGPSENDYVMQSVFEYSASHQWKGHLVKYALNANGTVGEKIWDAGSVLNTTAADNRSIWTVSPSLPNNLNNFTVANKSTLRTPLEENKATAFTDTELTNLISFIRGKDSYGEFPSGKDAYGTVLMPGERWKLADIYHSRAIVVGPPSSLASGGSTPNSESYYRFVNGYEGFKQSAICGSACSDRKEVVYVGGNDGMLHAFNSQTGKELWAFIPPGLLPDLKEVITSGNKSNSIYGVDGSPTVKDIFYSGQWHTVLIGGLRQGGHAYYALDITNPDTPQHLFSFAYNTTTNKVSYWNAAGTRTVYNATGAIPSAYNFSALGESWSQPVILKIKVGGSDKWVAVIAGGYNGGVNPSYGSTVYILDLTDSGKILNTITLDDNNSGNGIINAVPPRITAITGDSSSTFTSDGALIYVTDLEGKLWKINLTNTGTLYDKTMLFDSQATADNDRYAFHETTATINESGKLVQYFGTGNLQGMERVSSSIANRAFGIIDDNFPNFASTTAKTVSSLRNANLACPDNSQQGWYLNLNPNEKITAKATIKNRSLFLSRFTPSSGGVCELGTSKLTQLDFICGTTTQSTDLGPGIATEAVVYKNHVYVGISNNEADDGHLPEGFNKHGNLIVGTPFVTPAGDISVESWWEDF